MDAAALPAPATTVRRRLPDRRRTWTQKARVGGQPVYLSVSEYEDGRPGEVVIIANKVNTFARGILDTLSRTASLALQCGTPLEEIVRSMRGLEFPPEGVVIGSASVTKAVSIADYVAQELAATYRPPDAPAAEKATPGPTRNPDEYLGKSPAA